MEIAQATGVPPSGASNAEDFQPQTRNPQADALPTQPQTSNLQNPAVAEVLGKQNVRIIVPSAAGRTASDSYRTTAKRDGVGDIMATIILGIIIVVVVYFLFKRRSKKPSKTRPAAAPPLAEPEKPAKPAPKKPPKGKNKSKKKKQKRK